MTIQEWIEVGLQNGLVIEEAVESLTFDEAYSNWFRVKCSSCRMSTVDRYEVTYKRHFKDFDFIQKKLDSISERDLIEFLTRLIVSHGSLSSKEFSRIYQILHGVLNYARDMGLSGARLYDWNMVKRNLPDNRIMNFDKQECAISRESVEKLLKSVLDDKVYEQKQSASLCLCLNFYLGLRIGELSALQFADFDLTKRVVSVSRSDIKYYERDIHGNKERLSYASGMCKTSKSVRMIPLVSEAVCILEKIKEHHAACGYKSDYLVYDGSHCIRYRSLDRTLRRLCKLNGMPSFNTHLIRKTFATTLHHAGVPTKVIADLMGHSEMQTTERNYILSFEKKHDEYRQLMKKSLDYKIE